MTIAETLLPEFDQEMPITRRVLERVLHLREDRDAAEGLRQSRGGGVHHRGQLTVYLRLLDVPVPSNYGPTADEKPF